MTTPAGVPNLPAGALTSATLGQQLQDQTSAAWRGRAASRMPELFSASNGGDPLNDASVFGVIARVWSEVVSLVATADPADIQGPADIPELLTDFVRKLPVVGELLGLLDAILGNYTGDDQTLIAIQEIFYPIRKLLQLIAGQDVGWPTMDEITRGWSRLLDATAKAIEDLLQAIWDGVGGLGDWITGIFDPDRAKKALEETQRRIAAAVAQIIGIGGTVVNFAEYPGGSMQLPGWDRTRITGSFGGPIVRDGLLNIEVPPKVTGITTVSRWRAIYTDKAAAGADVRVDAVFGSVPKFLTNAQNRIIAKYGDNGDHAFISLTTGRADLGVNVGGRETILKQVNFFTFSPALTYSVDIKGNSMRLLKDGQQIGDPAVDSRIGALAGRKIGAEFYNGFGDGCGGLAAIGFRTPTTTLRVTDLMEGGTGE